VYLLDTNVISELRKPRPHGAVVAWVESVANQDLHISAVTLGELHSGVEITREQDPEKAVEIESWIDSVASTWNIVSLDGKIFRIWAELMHRRSDDLLVDGLIAATAIAHHFQVVTRNVRDFTPFEVETLDPFAVPEPDGDGAD
jgi:toxin FitB